MATKQMVGLTAYFVVGIGLVVTARYVTFAYGLREFLAGCLMGCVGVGMTLGGLAGTIFALDQRAVLAGRIPATAIPESTPWPRRGGPASRSA